MPDITQGRLTPLEPGFVTRVAQGMRYALSGVAPSSFGQGGWFGPGQPLIPQAPQAAGRQFDYPVGINLNQQPRVREAIGFAELRGLADSYDLLRLMIETRKDQIARLAWKIQPRIPGAAASDPRLALLENFFRFPDRQHGWADWLRMLLEDLLVIDAPALYRRKTLGGAPYAFEIIDGATIKRLIDDTGRTPLPPDPAYQQILKGLPAVDYTAADLLYLPRNPRSHRLYGYSPVEQIVMTVNIALRRQMTQLAYYTEGNTPEALIGVPQDWSPAQIREFQEYWDSLTAGNGAAKRRSKFVPGGLSYQPTRPPALTDDYDDWLARVVCFAFSISPTAFVKQVNRATAQTSQDTADAEGLAPLMRWVKDCIDRLLGEDFAAPDLEFAWVAEAAQNPLQQAQIDQIYVAAGIKTIDEVRASLGLAAVPGGAAPVVELPGLSQLPGDDSQKLKKWDFNVGQPRAPAGASGSTGGQWIAGDDGDDEDDGDNGDDSGDAQLIDVAAQSSATDISGKLSKQDFVDKYYDDAAAIAAALDTTTENILGLSAKESFWNQGNSTKPEHNFVQDGNNFFSLHCPNQFAISCEPADGDPDVSVAYFNSYADSGRGLISYIDKKDMENTTNDLPTIYGVKDPLEFATIMHNVYKFGIGGTDDSQYISDLAKIIRKLPKRSK